LDSNSIQNKSPTSCYTENERPRQHVIVGIIVGIAITVGILTRLPVYGGFQCCWAAAKSNGVGRNTNRQTCFKSLYLVDCSQSLFTEQRVSLVIT